jgi:hypothetical protein
MRAAATHPIFILVPPIPVVPSFVAAYIYLRCCVSGLLPSEEGLQNSETPPSSPLRILKEADNQWLNSEVIF